MKKDINMKEVLSYLDKMGIPYTVDNNPSPEKIEMIKKQIALREEKTRIVIEDYNKKINLA
jgi:hypothetical protein